ncbi:MAG: 3-isopropylmalate dehydratase small subunit [Betaproteobacteria bacterium]|nr:MAG: 3-isopropylmalate dehydratase small subunit [Betaproteobacteria bacterium]
MQPFTVLTAVAAPLDIAKIDTGVIIPGRFLRARRRPGEATYADAFLHDLRFDERDRPRPDFVLHLPAYRGAGILVTGPDFGCGSSREGAAYAVLDYGVRALVGPSFGDVFVGNCMQNGIVPAVLALETIQELWRQLRAAPGARMTVDLVEQAVVAPDGRRHAFDFDPTRKQRLIEGLDDVGVTLTHLAAIEAFESKHAARMPWRASKII